MHLESRLTDIKCTRGRTYVLGTQVQNAKEWLEESGKIGRYCAKNCSFLDNIQQCDILKKGLQYVESQIGS